MKFMIAFAMALFFSLSGVTAFAAEALLINVDDANPPFMFGKEGKAQGVYPAILRAAFAKLNVPVSIEVKPWKRALTEIDEGKGGVGGIYKNDERAKKFDFSDSILTENTAVYFNKEKPIEFKAVPDLVGRRIGLIRGWSYGDEFDAARKAGKLTVEETQSDQQNLMKLANGRLDAVLAIEEAGKAIITASKFTQVSAAGTYLASNKAHLAFNKSAGQADLLGRFNKVIAEMKKDGSLDKIVLQELSH